MQVSSTLNPACPALALACAPAFGGARRCLTKSRLTPRPRARGFHVAQAVALAFYSAVNLAFGSLAHAEKLPLWEAGFGIAPVTFPDYRGANQQSAYVLPFPYFIYRGDRFKVDRSGPRSVLFENERLQLDLSINA